MWDVTQGCVSLHQTMCDVLSKRQMMPWITSAQEFDSRNQMCSTLSLIQTLKIHACACSLYRNIITGFDIALI